jgi:hypothetical protein
MSIPPPQLDGADVLWWAWSDDRPFGAISGEAVHGFAVCRYDKGKLYRFSCGRNWEVLNDMDHEDEKSAKADIPHNYDASRVEWHPYVSQPGGEV